MSQRIMRSGDMEKEKSPKLMTISCGSCNRKTHATMKQFVDGMECPGCGMPITIGNDDSSGFNSFLHKAECVNCHHEYDIPMEYSFKYMSVCPKCDTIFIRTNMIFDTTATDKESESFKLMEMLYPSIPNNLNSDLSDTTPASDTEMKMLGELNIKASSPRSRTVQRLVKQIFDMVNVTVMSHFSAVVFLDYHTRSRLYMNIAKSRLIRKIYFEQRIERTELEQCMREGLGDDDLFQAMSSAIDLASYEIAAVYISHFAKVIYDKEIDSTLARRLALLSFGRGFGHAIRKAGYFIFNPEDNRVKSIAKLSIPAMRSFYTQHNLVNDSLLELFAANKFDPPPRKGCLGIILIVGSAAFFLGKYIGNTMNI